MSLIRSMRGGKDHDAEWGKRMKGSGVYADLIAKRFKLACDRLGLNQWWTPLASDWFKPPPAAGDQLRLL
jgi:DNA repair photolyase